METRTYTVSEARKSWADMFNHVAYAEQPAVITKNGKDAVAVVPYRLFDFLTKLEAVLDLEKAEKALEDYEANGGTSLDDLKKELGLDEPDSMGGQVVAMSRPLGKGRRARPEGFTKRDPKDPDRRD